LGKIRTRAVTQKIDDASIAATAAVGETAPQVSSEIRDRTVSASASSVANPAERNEDDDMPPNFPIDFKKNSNMRDM
jgi:hypothetical protein